ncbi:MAG: heterodisulfide reductase-related iron-sulfur binding cluster, partial [Acidimicrobiales bacterium]
MAPSREVFQGLSRGEIVLWYGLIVVSTTVFVWGAAQLVLKYRRGRSERLGAPSLGRRSADMLKVTLSHSRLQRRDHGAGMAHFLVFYGFLLLLAGTTILGIQTDFASPVFGWRFWQGGFYLGYKLVLDISGLMLVVGLVALAVRRGALKPPKLDYRRPDRAACTYDRSLYRVGDWAFLTTLLWLAVTGFLLEGLQLASVHPTFADWTPVGWVLAKLFTALGLSGQAAGTAHHVLWWIHGLSALTFVASIPYTKAVHMLAAPATLTVRDPAAGRALVPVPEDAASVGYGTIVDLSWRHLLSLDACTKCGKCTEACPAANSGYPLSPRDLILDLREVADAALGIHAAAGVGGVGTAAALGNRSPSGLVSLPLVDGGAGEGGAGASGAGTGSAIHPESLWSCMQCMACVEICPVGIEHVPIINQLRRRLVDEGEMDSMLQTTLETIQKSGNSFGEPKRKRGKWTAELGFPVKDIRKEPASLLWFVGDYASFDPRNQRVSRTLASVLESAGVDFGILFDAERTGGCDVRRVGEEGLWAELAEHNVAAISECDFDRIFTSDAHTFNTLRNEYPQAGGSWTVLHHSQLLLELISGGVLRPTRKLGYRVTYHDPCNLGRYNGVFDAPRQVLEACGVDLVEMPRSRDNSFCCGAGGGRIWMRELRAEGSRRPSEQRIDEAVALG